MYSNTFIDEQEFSRTVKCIEKHYIELSVQSGFRTIKFQLTYLLGPFIPEFCFGKFSSYEKFIGKLK